MLSVPRCFPLRNFVGEFFSNGFVVLSLLTLCSVSHGGTKDGGGGKGVVCRDGQNQILSVELLDLWEAENVYNRKIQPSTKSVADQVDQAIEDLKRGIGDSGLPMQHLNAQTGKWETLSGADAINIRLHQYSDLLVSPYASGNVERKHGIILSDTADSFEEMRPSNCGIEQIVRFDDFPGTFKIYVSQDLVDKMDPVNQAALYVHEALYAYLRENGESNSLRVRRAVGYVFSGQVFESLESVLPVQYVECRDRESDPSIDFYVFENSTSTQNFVINKWLGDRPAVGFYPAELQHKPLESFITNHSCTGLADYRGDGIMPSSESPADFDRSIFYFFGRCRNNKTKFAVTFGPDTKKQPVTCAEVRKK